VLPASPLKAQPTTAIGAARESTPYGSMAAALTRGGSARAAVTITSATEKSATIELNGAAALMSA